MKKSAVVIWSIFVVLILVGFGFGIDRVLGPYPTQILVDMHPATEVGFAIPKRDIHEGEGLQMSEELLRSYQIRTQQFSLPLRKNRLSYALGAFEWIPDAIVIKANLTPATVEMTSITTDKATGKTNAILGESMDGKNFTIGLNISAKIIDPVKYVLKYGDLPLDECLLKHVRGQLSTNLNLQTKTMDVMECSQKINSIMEAVGERTIKFFKEDGIQIYDFGLTEGLVFSNPEIQAAIDKKFIAEQERASQEARVSIQQTKLDGLVKMMTSGNLKLEDLERLVALDYLMSCSDANRSGSTTQLIPPLTHKGAFPLNIRGVLSDSQKTEK